MSINGPPDCGLCERPINKGSEVLLNKQLFHPGCAVAVAKEKKHGSNAHDARRSEESNTGGTLAGADPAGN